jgi:diketogulonate reductase-like aldo/keto reductase
MPVLGLGVARMAEGAETEQSVLWALEAGYRLIDTAKIYGNEAAWAVPSGKAALPM